MLNPMARALSPKAKKLSPMAGAGGGDFRLILFGGVGSHIIRLWWGQGRRTDFFPREACHRCLHNIMNKLFTRHEEKYILQKKPGTIIYLANDYVIVTEESIETEEKKVEVINAKTQKRDMKTLDGKLCRADTFLVDWDEDSFPKENFGQVKWT
jgi:hypothetical protein